MSVIAIYLPSLRGGGAERMMVNLANEINRLGHSVEMVLARAEGPFLAELGPQIRIIDLNSASVIRSLPRLVAYLKFRKPKALLATIGHANIVAITAAKLAKFKGRVVLREANMDSLYRDTACSMKSKVLAIANLKRWFYPMADAIVAVSKGVAKDLEREIGTRNVIYTVYNPVITQELFEKAKAPLYHPWFATPEVPVVLGVGRLTKLKGFSTLIRAFSEVKKQIDCRLIILGEGEIRAELENLISSLEISEFVDLHGFVKNPFPFMAGARLFVLSSESEGLPGALIQAMALETFVVSTDCPSGPSEILEGGVYGSLVPVGSVSSLANAIHQNLVTKPKPIDQIRINELFNASGIAQKYLGILLGNF